MKNLCYYTQKDLKKMLANLYRSYEPIKYEVLETDDYIYVKGPGTCPVCLVCHLDTVFENTYIYRYHYGKPVPIPKDPEPRKLEWIEDKEKKVLWSPDGAGFDDRVGVYIALMLIDMGADVLFCTDEEVGCLGAQVFCEDFKKLPSNIKYFIELDRAYTNDCVFYLCTNKKFQKYVETFGFVTDIGSFSDIYYLGPHFNIACVNLSVGYFDEHNKTERLYYEYTDRTIERVRAMLAEAGGMGVPYYKHGLVNDVYNDYSKYYGRYSYFNDEGPDEEDDFLKP